MGTAPGTGVGRLFTEEAFPWRQSQILPGQLFSSGVQNVDVKQPSQAAAVLNGHLIPGLLAGRWKRILFCPTGALLSPTSTQQGESIPGVCHAVALEGGH